MRAIEGIRPITETGANKKDLADMIGVISLCQAQPDAATDYWDYVRERFMIERSYGERRFDWLAWEAEVLLAGIDATDKELAQEGLLQ